MVLSPHPAPLEGRYASSRTLGQGAMDVLVSPDERRPGRTARSCGPDLPTLGSSPWTHSRATEAIKPGTPGRARSIKTIAQGMFWRKIVNKINGKSGMCPPCVAIRGGHDFSTTCPWKAAHWRCGPPNVQSGESEITPGKTRQVDLRDNYVASEVVLCWAGANAGFVPPKRPRRKRA